MKILSRATRPRGPALDAPGAPTLSVEGYTKRTSRDRQADVIQGREIIIPRRRHTSTALPSINKGYLDRKGKGEFGSWVGALCPRGTKPFSLMPRVR